MAVLIRLGDGVAVASTISQVDWDGVLQRKGYCLHPFYFGDYDYLLDAAGRRLGVSFLPLTDEILNERLFSESRNAERDGGEVSFWFGSVECSSVETAQEMGTVVYRSPTGEAVLLLPDCELDPDALERDLIWTSF